MDADDEPRTSHRIDEGRNLALSDHQGLIVSVNVGYSRTKMLLREVRHQQRYRGSCCLSPTPLQRPRFATFDHIPHLPSRSSLLEGVGWFCHTATRRTRGLLRNQNQTLEMFATMLERDCGHLQFGCFQFSAAHTFGQKELKMNRLLLAIVLSKMSRSTASTAALRSSRRKWGCLQGKARSMQMLIFVGRTCEVPNE